MIKIIGHRGARGLAPENTLPSIQKALDYHVDEVEIDVRVTKDGVPVLGHNRYLEDSTGRYIIADHTLAELRVYRKDLATLSEALALIDNHSIAHVEVKHGESVHPIARVIEKVQTSQPIVIGSKSQKTLRQLHGLLPSVPTIVIEPWSSIRAVYRARALGTKRISMRSWWLWSGVLRSLHRKGYQVVPYTINNPTRVTKWQPYIYGVFTDYPDRFTSLRRD
jgi:glycerophosphoryl diester phosphodiesterase